MRLQRAIPIIDTRTGKTPTGVYRKYQDTMIDLLRKDKWIPNKVFERMMFGLDAVENIMYKLRGRGYNVISEKRDGKWGKVLILTEGEEMKLPVEVDDCGKVEIVSYKKTMGG